MGSAVRQRCPWYRRITLKLLLASGVAAVIGAYFYTPSHTEKVAEEVRKMSETNLDERNAGQIEALKKFVADGGILSPEQQRQIEAAAAKTSGRPVLVRAKKAISNLFGETEFSYAIPEDIAPEKLQSICNIPKGEYSIHVSEGSRLLIRDMGQVFAVRLTGPADTTSHPEALHRSDYRPFGFQVNGSGNGEKVVVGEDGCLTPSFNTTFHQDAAFRSGEWKVVKGNTIVFQLTPA